MGIKFISHKVILKFILSTSIVFSGFSTFLLANKFDENFMRELDQIIEINKRYCNVTNYTFFLQGINDSGLSIDYLKLALKRDNYMEPQQQEIFIQFLRRHEAARSYISYILTNLATQQLAKGNARIQLYVCLRPLAEIYIQYPTLTPKELLDQCTQFINACSKCDIDILQMYFDTQVPETYCKLAQFEEMMAEGAQKNEVKTIVDFINLYEKPEPWDIIIPSFSELIVINTLNTIYNYLISSEYYRSNVYLINSIQNLVKNQALIDWIRKPNRLNHLDPILRQLISDTINHNPNQWNQVISKHRLSIAQAALEDVLSWLKSQIFSKEIQSVLSDILQGSNLLTAVNSYCDETLHHILLSVTTQPGNTIMPYNAQQRSLIDRALEIMMQRCLGFSQHYNRYPFRLINSALYYLKNKQPAENVASWLCNQILTYKGLYIEGQLNAQGQSSYNILVQTPEGYMDRIIKSSYGSKVYEILTAYMKFIDQCMGYPNKKLLKDLANALKMGICDKGKIYEQTIAKDPSVQSIINFLKNNFQFYPDILIGILVSAPCEAISQLAMRVWMVSSIERESRVGDSGNRRIENNTLSPITDDDFEAISNVIENKEAMSALMNKDFVSAINYVETPKEVNVIRNLYRLSLENKQMFNDIMQVYQESGISDDLKEVTLAYLSIT